MKLLLVRTADGGRRQGNLGCGQLELTLALSRKETGGRDLSQLDGFGA
jgi:hypothetical protein